MPARLSALVAVLEKHGIAIEKPKSGSHWKCRKTGFRVFPVPAHNGLRSEIDEIYLRALSRHFELDFADLKKSL